MAVVLVAAVVPEVLTVVVRVPVVVVLVVAVMPVD